MMFLLKWNGITATNNSTFYSCTYPTGGYPVTLPNAINCSIHAIDPYLTREHDFHVFTKRAEPVQTRAYKCYEILNTACTFQSITFGKAVMSRGEIKRSVEERVCRQTVSELQTCGYNGSACFVKSFGLHMYKADARTWHSDVPLQLKFSWCCKTVCASESKNIIVVEGKVGALTTNHTVSDIGDVSHCRLSNGMCKHPEYTIIWTAMPDNVCPYVYLGQYKGKSNGAFITIDDLQVASAAIMAKRSSWEDSCQGDPKLKSEVLSWMAAAEGWLLLGSKGYPKYINQPLNN